MRNWRPLIVTVTCDMTRSTGRMILSTVVGLDDGTDGLDGGMEAAGDLVVGGFQRAGPRRHGVEVGGEPRAIRAERVQLIGQAQVGAIGLAAALRRSLEPVERQH